MDNFLEKLLEFIKENEKTKDKQDLYFEYSNSKMSYWNAYWVAREINDLKELVTELSDKLAMFEDFIRLLRKENFELKDKQNERN